MPSVAVLSDNIVFRAASHTYTLTGLTTIDPDYLIYEIP